MTETYSVTAMLSDQHFSYWKGTGDAIPREPSPHTDTVEAADPRSAYRLFCLKWKGIDLPDEYMLLIPETAPEKREQEIISLTVLVDNDLWVTKVIEFP
ncbi:MAG: hypothetical protein ACYC7E_04055 [Armatimonadota bacterium]